MRHKPIVFGHLLAPVLLEANVPKHRLNRCIFQFYPLQSTSFSSSFFYNIFELRGLSGKDCSKCQLPTCTAISNEQHVLKFNRSLTKAAGAYFVCAVIEMQQNKMTDYPLITSMAKNLFPNSFV